MNQQQQTGLCYVYVVVPVLKTTSHGGTLPAATHLLKSDPMDPSQIRHLVEARRRSFKCPFFFHSPLLDPIVRSSTRACGTRATIAPCVRSCRRSCAFGAPQKRRSAWGRRPSRRRWRSRRDLWMRIINRGDWSTWDWSTGS